MIVYFLNHMRIDPKYEEDAKFLGFFSARCLAEASVELHRPLEGFRDYPDGFKIELIEVDSEFWNEGFISVMYDASDEEQSSPPPWARGKRCNSGESSNAFAARLCDENCGPGNYRTGPDSEFSELAKFASKAR